MKTKTPATPPKKLEFPQSKPQCRGGTIVIFNKITKSVTLLPARCRKWSCPDCAKHLRDQWAQAIAAARPNRFITLTCKPAWHQNPQNAYEHMKEALPLLVAKLRKMCGELEYAAVWELHESGYPHLHIAARGAYLPIKLINHIWSSLHIGENNWISAVINHSGAARYAAKYITKTISKAKDLIHITRIIQYSKNYFASPPPKQSNLEDQDVQAAYFKQSPNQIYYVLTRNNRYFLADIRFQTGGTLHPVDPANCIEDLLELWAAFQHT